MTKKFKVFLPFISCSRLQVNQKIQVSHGSLTPSVIKSVFQLLPISLFHLFCISQIRMVLCPTHYGFQHLTTGKMVSSAKERKVIYYLVTKEQGKIQAHQIKGNTEKENVINASKIRASRFFLFENIVP